MKKVLLVLILTVVVQAQEIQVCAAVVHPCEMSYDGQIKPIGIDDSSACFGSAQRQCGRLLEYVCDKEVTITEDLFKTKVTSLNSKVKSLTLENKALKVQLARAKLQLRRKK